MRRALWRVTGIAGLALLLGACTVVQSRTFVLDTATTDERPGNYWNLPLADGQIVLSEEGGPHSLLFCLSAERYVDFTHAGVLIFEGDQPYVYEMKGAYEGCFVDRPTDGIVGMLQRTHLEDYARAYLYFEVLDPPSKIDAQALVTWVRARYEEQVPFDAYFDFADHEALYCTEFVQLALEAGGAPPVELRSVQQHPSIQRLFGWLNVDRQWCLPAGTFHDPGRRVAALSQLPSQTAVEGYFAGKRELHARFTDDQQLGNLFSINAWADITLRDEVVYYLRRTTRLFDVQLEPSSDKISAAARSLADEVFGVRPAPALDTTAADQTP